MIIKKVFETIDRRATFTLGFIQARISISSKLMRKETGHYYTINNCDSQYDPKEQIINNLFSVMIRTGWKIIFYS